PAQWREHAATPFESADVSRHGLVSRREHSGVPYLTVEPSDGSATVALRIPEGLVSTEWTPTGDVVAAFPSTLLWWSPRTGESRVVFAPLRGFAGPIAVSPDGRRAAFLSILGELHVVDLSSGDTLHRHRIAKPGLWRPSSLVFVDSHRVLMCGGNVPSVFGDVRRSLTRVPIARCGDVAVGGQTVWVRDGDLIPYDASDMSKGDGIRVDEPDQSAYDGWLAVGNTRRILIYGPADGSPFGVPRSPATPPPWNPVEVPVVRPERQAAFVEVTGLTDQDRVVLRVPGQPDQPLDRVGPRQIYVEAPAKPGVVLDLESVDRRLGKGLGQPLPAVGAAVFDVAPRTVHATIEASGRPASGVQVHWLDTVYRTEDDIVELPPYDRRGTDFTVWDDTGRVAFVRNAPAGRIDVTLKDPAEAAGFRFRVEADVEVEVVSGPYRTRVDGEGRTSLPLAVDRVTLVVGDSVFAVPIVDGVAHLDMAIVRLPWTGCCGLAPLDGLPLPEGLEGTDTVQVAAGRWRIEHVAPASGMARAETRQLAAGDDVRATWDDASDMRQVELTILNATGWPQGGAHVDLPDVAGFVPPWVTDVAGRVTLWRPPGTTRLQVRGLGVLTLEVPPGDEVYTATLRPPEPETTPPRRRRRR
ncbi:MAG: hypothetical protein AAF211_08670, partial [Myxococcota bacterium]